jgi:hypothetical protein
MGRADVSSRLLPSVLAISGSDYPSLHNSLRHPFPVVMGDIVHRMEILEEQRTIMANSLNFVWCLRRNTDGVCVDSTGFPGH